MKEITAESSLLVEKAIEKLFDYGPQLLGSILILIVGIKVINKLSKKFRELLAKRDIDKSLIPFLSNIVGVTLKIFLFVTVGSMIGIQTTSLLALLGSAGLAVGLALQGSLANFAGGVLLLILKPFKVDDFIETRGESGTVREIQLFYTVIETPQAQVITIPNGGLSNDVIKNYSVRPTRRMDFTFGISYTDDIDKARAIIKSVIEADKRILTNPAPDIFVATLNDSSVDFSVRVWIEQANVWPTYFALIESVKKAFDEKGISIPFPQRDVHIYQK